jgi:hypothetical protein
LAITKPLSSRMTRNGQRQQFLACGTTPSTAAFPDSTAAAHLARLRGHATGERMTTGAEA